MNSINVMTYDCASYLGQIGNSSGAHPTNLLVLKGSVGYIVPRADAGGECPAHNPADLHIQQPPRRHSSIQHALFSRLAFIAVVVSLHLTVSSNGKCSSAAPDTNMTPATNYEVDVCVLSHRQTWRVA